MRVRMTFVLAAGWLALALPGHAAAQAGSNAVPATCGVDIPNQKADAQEAACLREFARFASRKNDLLTLRLENGRSKAYRDDAKACDADDAKCTYYRLVAFHSKAQVYSIRIQYYEGSGFELLSARTGNVLRLSGTPYFSPDGSRFIVIDNDYAFGGEYDLAIGSAAKGLLSLEWQQVSKEGPLEWQLQRWIDNDRIALRVFKADTDQRCPDNDCDAMLVRFADSWALRRLPAKQ